MLKAAALAGHLDGLAIGRPRKSLAGSSGKAMRMKRNGCLMLAAWAVGVTLPSASSLAQVPEADASAPAETSPDIRIDVTGSNIKRVESEGALPVTVITREEIDRSGATTPMELLQLVSANSSLNAISLANVIGATTFSAQTASLRGLGGAHTLVLINGHRIEGFPGETAGVQGVTLSTIPFSAIERVEILRDGASAIYGSDAIAGVINFITRSDYTGAEVTGFYGAPTRGGGGEQYQGQATAGSGDLTRDHYNVFVSIEYNEQRRLDQASRSFSNSSYRPDIGLIGLSSNTFPARITTGDIGAVNNAQGAPVVANSAALCAPGVFVDDDIVGTNCFFDPARVHGIDMIPEDKSNSFFGSGRLRISADLDLYGQATYTNDATRVVIQPGPISNLFVYGPDNTPATILLQPTSPYYPHALAAVAGVDGSPLNIRYRTFDNGFRDMTDTNDHMQVIGGARGSWRDFDWDASGYYGRGTTSEHLNDGFQDYRLLLPLLNSGTVNFFGPNSPDVVARLRATNFVGDTFDSTGASYGTRMVVSGDIAKLPAGPLAIATGLETRRDSLDQRMPEAMQDGYITGYGGALKNLAGSRTQYAAFTEIDAPIAAGLETDIALRYDHYSDFGGTTNPKFSLRWQPTRSLLLRASYGTGFLAPGLFQLFTPAIPSVTQPGLSDPLRCPVTHDTGFDCNTQFGVLIGGNPALKPETSEQATAGVVWDAFTGASLSVDWFKINLANAIGTLDATTILGNPARWGYLVTRAPPAPGSGLPGRIVSILATYQNVAAEKIEGYDIEAHYRTPIERWGRLAFDVSGTYYSKYDVQNLDGSYSGQIGTAYGLEVTGVIPRWKQYASLTWDEGPWSATLANTYQSSYTDQQPDLDRNLRTVGALSLWDLQGTYTGFRDCKLTLGVKNLLDRDPPLSNQQSTFTAGFDPTYYDPRTRFVYSSVTYRFR